MPLLHVARSALPAVLCAAAVCCAADPGERCADLTATFGHLEQFARGVAALAARPAAAELAPRLDALQQQLDGQRAQLDGMTSQLGRLEAAASREEARDCSDLPAGSQSGVYLVRPGLGRAVPAVCDLETAGGNWTVIQRRADVRPHQDFFRGWEEYKWGLGELDGEFWWGLEHLWLLTSQLDRRYELRVELADFDGERRHAVYQGFSVASEGDGYRLTAGAYSGDAGDSLRRHIGQKFSTKDKDQDTYSDNCAVMRQAGFWFEKCHDTNLNGRYLSGPTTGDDYGVNWKAWRGHHYSLKTAEMKIRPTKKLPTA